MNSMLKKINWPKAFLFISFFVFIICCKNSKNRVVTPAFYHWKNTLDISDSEFEYLRNLETKKLYLRFFDVDLDGNKAIPVSILETRTQLPDSIEIVPTIFITNRTMIKTRTQDIPKLADQIFQKTNAIKKQFKKNKITEIQFDCDWSPKSKSNYFKLLDILKSKFSTQAIIISSTIRLHQIKYFKTTGVPPVDRGVLMFYNMDDINNPNTDNSIINLEVAKQYLHNFQDYPLKLDIALPVFKWGIVFQENKLVKIINNLDQIDLQDSTRFIKIKKNRFELIKSTYLKGYYLYQKDQIRLESVDSRELKKTADLLSGILAKDDINIIFYHLDSIQITDYPHETLKNIYNRFH